jgi:predicted DNA-binding transcriptional regulator AlpA
MDGKLDIVGIAEIAERLHVARNTAWRWSQRADFPEPAARLTTGPIWHTSDIERWAERLPLPRGRRAGSRRGELEMPEALGFKFEWGRSPHGARRIVEALRRLEAEKSSIPYGSAADRIEEAMRRNSGGEIRLPAGEDAAVLEVLDILSRSGDFGSPLEDVRAALGAKIAKEST